MDDLGVCMRLCCDKIRSDRPREVARLAFYLEVRRCIRHLHSVRDGVNCENCSMMLLLPKCHLTMQESLEPSKKDGAKP